MKPKWNNELTEAQSSLGMRVSKYPVDFLRLCAHNASSSCRATVEDSYKVFLAPIQVQVQIAVAGLQLDSSISAVKLFCYSVFCVLPTAQSYSGTIMLSGYTHLVTRPKLKKFNLVHQIIVLMIQLGRRKNYNFIL